MSIQIVYSQSHDPFFNLALEEYLSRQMSGRLSPDAVVASNPQPDAILYLWQNQDTVVIGRNQNAWAECKTALLEAEGGRLARRTTGGGAVFHDLGNLNFSLLLPQPVFNLDRNFQLIVDAVRSAGIPAERSGRNDILADGQKFSGNAFRIDHGVGLHHGTLLVSSAFERVGRYLTVAPAKLAAKGIASVRSRITNLCTFRPDLDIATWMNALENTFVANFGVEQPIVRFDSTDLAVDPILREIETQFASWSWRYGETLTFDAELSEHFSWGHLHFGLQIEHGHVSTVRVFSDALDCDWIAQLEKHLLGLPFSSAGIADTIRRQGEMTGGFGVSRQQMATDLADLVAEQGW